MLAIIKWADGFFGQGAHHYYRADCVLKSELAPPPIVGGYIPDFYAEIDGTLTIGEAKTMSDLETPHSHEQLKSAVSYLLSISNTAPTLKLALVIATPWPAQNAAKRIIRRVNRDVGFSNYTLMVLAK